MYKKIHILFVFFSIIVIILSHQSSLVAGTNPNLSSSPESILIEPGIYIDRQILANSSCWFHFQHGKEILKNLSITFQNQTANLDLYLWNKSIEVKRSNGTVDSEQIDKIPLVRSSDLIYIEVRNLNCVNTTTFNLTLILEDELESNNQITNATILPNIPSHLYGLRLNDQDWFQIRCKPYFAINIWVNWLGPFHTGIVSLFYYNESFALKNKTYHGGYATTQVSKKISEDNFQFFNYYRNLNESDVFYFVINDTINDTSISYNLHVEILKPDKKNYRELEFSRPKDQIEDDYLQTPVYNGNLFDDGHFWLTRSYRYPHLLIKLRCVSYIYGFSPKILIKLTDSKGNLLKRSMCELDQTSQPFSNIYYNTNDRTSGKYFVTIEPMESDNVIAYELYAILDDEMPNFDIWNPVGNLSGERPGDTYGSAEMWITGFLYLFIFIAISVIMLLKHIIKRLGRRRNYP